MKAGKLDRQITFQERSSSQDSNTGAFTYSWANLGANPTVWAEVQDIIPSRFSGEDVSNGFSYENRPCRIRCRYRSDITGDMRIVYGSRTLRIVSGPAELGREEGLEILAEDWQNKGDEA